jgi:hypothetical protein
LFIFNFFILDTTIPFSHFLLPNKYGSYKLKGRKAIFDSDNKGNLRSLILKEGISNRLLEVFVFLLLFIFVIIFIVIYIFDYFCCYLLLLLLISEMRNVFFFFLYE